MGDLRCQIRCHLSEYTNPTLPYLPPTVPASNLTLPHPIPYPRASFFQSCFTALNRPVNQPCMPRSVLLDDRFDIFLSHFRFVLVHFAQFPSVVVRFGKLWHWVDLKPGVGFWLKRGVPKMAESIQYNTMWQPGLDPSFYSSTLESVWSTYYLHFRCKDFSGE